MAGRNIILEEDVDSVIAVCKSLKLPPRLFRKDLNYLYKSYGPVDMHKMGDAAMNISAFNILETDLGRVMLATPMPPKQFLLQRLAPAIRALPHTSHTYVANATWTLSNDPSQQLQLTKHIITHGADFDNLTTFITTDVTNSPNIPNEYFYVMLICNGALYEKRWV